MTMFREVENKGLPCHLFGYILDAEEQNGFYDSLDIYFSALGDGVAEMEIPVAPMHYNSGQKPQLPIMDAPWSFAKAKFIIRKVICWPPDRRHFWYR